MSASARISQPTAIGLLACSTLILELVLTRAYSVVFFYHFSFVVVSLAMLGLSAGSVWVFLRPKWGEPERIRLSVARASSAFALASAIGYVLQFYIPHVFRSEPIGWLATFAFLCLASFPFVMSGLAISLLLTQQGPQVAKLYAADLFGAAVGCLLVPVLLSYADPSTAVFASSLMAALVAWGLERRLRHEAIVLALLATTIGSYAVGGFRFPYVKGRPDILHQYVGWNSFSRVTVSSYGSMPLWMSNFQGPRPKSLNVRIDAGAGTDIVSSADSKSLQALAFDITAMVYHLRNPARVLVLGCGGGRDVATALLFGNQQVTAVEMNDLLIRLLEGKYRQYSGNLAGRASILWREARAYLRDTQEQYDIIQMSLIDTAAAVASGAYLLTEHSLYTVEAWTDIIKRLSPKGVFSVTRNRYKGWPLEVDRCLSLAVEALRRNGVEDPRGHVILIEGEYNAGNYQNDCVGLTTMLISRQPFDSEDLRRARNMEGFAFVERDVARGNFSPGRLRILDPATYTAALLEAPVDISAPTDNRPFFFFHLKPGKLLRGDFTAGLAQKSMSILPQLLLGVSLLTAALTGIPLLVSRRSAPWDLSLYFGSIGASFMAVEVGFLQIFSIYLGHPLYSMVVVLFGFLLATGSGSYLSDRLGSRKVWVLPLLCCLLLVTGLTYPTLLALPGGVGLRIAVCLSLIVPLGLLMGMAFPLGWAELYRRDARLAAWCWGLNGATSVVSSVLTMMMMLVLGLQSVFFAGLLGYLLAALAYRRLCR